MDTKIITRRTVIGYGYSAILQPDGRIVPPEVPCHVGTYNTLGARIAADRTLQAIKSGGGMYASAYYVRHNGSWRMISNSVELDALEWLSAIEVELR